MLISSDALLTIQPGETAITTVGTVCASAKTIAPPPPVTPGLEYKAMNYTSVETWQELAQIIAAAKELEMAGGFGNLLFPSQAAIDAMIDAEVSKQLDNKIKLLMTANPKLSRSAAEEIVKKDLERIREVGSKTVLEDEKRKRQEQITQLAIWTTLGMASGDEKNKVSPETIEKDILKELSEQIQMDKTLLAQLGGKLSKNGEFIPSKAQKKALEQKTELIFDVVNLTLNRSKEPGLKNIATLPQDDTCSTICGVAERAFKQGNYPEAQTLLATALEEAEALGEADPRLSRCLNSLGMCFLDMTSYAQAEANFKRALGLREKVFGAESKEAAEVNNNLGLTNQQQEKYQPAGEYFRKAVAIFEKTIGKTTNTTAEALNNLGKNHNLQQQADEAKSPLAKALTFGIMNCPKDLKGNSLYTPFVADVETNLADTYIMLGEFARAAALYQKALMTDQKQLGEFHPFVAKILEGMALAASKLGQTKDADTFSRQAQEVREKTLGKDNHEIAMLPLSHDAFTRIWNFVEGKKEIRANVENLKAARNISLDRGADRTKVNRPIKDKWALVVGISKFQDPAINLKYAAKDATDFANYLIKEANFAPDHVRLITNEKATSEEIMSQLGDKWLPRVANPDDLVLIFFSSHGSPTQMDVSSVNYLVAHNTDKNSLYATGIPLQQFADTIKNRVHSDRVVLLMDACHSGAAVGAKGIFRNFGVDANQVAQGTGQMVICSSGSNQTSWESKRYENGVFTHYLIEGLKKDPKLGNVFDFMKSKVQEEVQLDRNGEVQTPVLQSKWQGNDLTISVPPAAPRAGVQ
ncbi:MAG: tetratricopeptide repeat protein, partial [Candidatus Obscuribacterales bacterium]|nr:tetratricopeptide repeat protein [Candidatus Obscuribacterales bacterium]